MMKISTTSWHFRLIEHTNMWTGHQFRNPVHYPDMANSCAYWKALTSSIFQAIFIFACVGLAVPMVSWMFILLPICAAIDHFGFISWITDPRMLDVGRNIWLAYGGAVILGLVLRVALPAWFAYKERRENAELKRREQALDFENSVDEPAGFFQIAKAALKDKLCAKIEVQ